MWNKIYANIKPVLNLFYTFDVYQQNHGSQYPLKVLTGISTLKIGVSGSRVRIPRIGINTTPISYECECDNIDDENIENSRAFKFLNRAIDIGCTFWDTSEISELGQEENNLANVLKTRRSKVFLWRKLDSTIHAFNSKEKKALFELFFGTKDKHKYIRECVSKSLKRLGVSYIDLYYIHRVDPDTPIEEIITEMAKLVKKGKSRYSVLLECTPDELRRAHKVHPIATIQMEYSLWSTCVETNGMLATYRELGITVVAYSPLGNRYMLSRFSADDSVPETHWLYSMIQFKGGNADSKRQLAHIIELMAEKRNCKPGQLAIAWLLAQEENMVVILGTKTIEYLEENFPVTQVRLSENELQELRKYIDIANNQNSYN